MTAFAFSLESVSPFFLFKFRLWYDMIWLIELKLPNNSEIMAVQSMFLGH